MKKSDISQNNLARIQKAVTHLGETDWEVISLLSGGLTGMPVYKIKVKETFYAIKLEDASDSNFDLVRCYKILDAVSRGGIAPRVYYTNPEEGIILMECINSQFQAATTSPYLEKLAAVARQLHQMELFEEWKSLGEIWDFFAKKIPEKYLKHSSIEPCLSELKKLEALVFFTSDIRSSHGDFHIANILFDGDKYLLVDWQAAAPRSLYFDLACYATFMFGANDDLCHAFLKAYLEREPKEEEKAKYTLMRLYTNIYYGIGFISLSLQNQDDAALMTNEAIAKLPHHGVVLQEVASAFHDPLNKQKFGFACMKSSLEMMASSQYREAVKVVTSLRQCESKEEDKVFKPK